MARTLYEILGVPPSAGDAQLRGAYQRIRARLLKTPRDEASIEALQIAREAFAILSNPSKRARYDEKLAMRNPLDGDDGKPDNHDEYELDDLPRLFGRCKQRMAKRHGNGREDKPPYGFSFAQKPQFLLAMAALLLVYLYWSSQQEKLHRLEARLAATEKAMAAAKADDALKQREQALQQAQAEMARSQQELAEKQTEAQQTMDIYKSILSRQVDSQTELANRNLDLAAPKVGAETERTQSEARLTNAQARNAEIAARQMDNAYKTQISREAIGLARETALYNKYREQQLHGDDGFSRSNPGLNR